MMRARSAPVLTLATVLLLAGPSYADALGDVREALARSETTLKDLEQRILAPALLERAHKITARLSDGQLFFLTQDYDRAAMVLLDVVEDPRSRDHIAYRDALYYLSESLYRLRNYNAAATYFELVATQGTDIRQQEAIGRLLEIALVTENARGAQAYLTRATKLLTRAPDPRLLYAVGKYHYRTGELGLAEAAFRRVPDTHPVAPRARYFLGVVEVKQKKYAGALKTFQALVDTALDGELAAAENQHAQDQARLAIARIHYELGQFDQSVGAYSSVPRASGAFDEAMYESVWISVKQQDYHKALRRLEILLISQTSALRGPDARLLKGQLLMMLKRFEAAAEAFQEVLFEFGPIQNEMKQVVRDNRGDLVRYFNRVIGTNIADFDLTSFLPPRAAEFAGPDVDADRALLLVGDLAAQKRDVDDARRTIRRIDVALAADSRIEIFPKLHDGWLKALEVRAALVGARAKLNDAAAGGVSGQPGYDGVRAEREQRGKAFAGTPRSAFDLQARDARVDDEMARLEQESFKLRIAIQGLEAQLAAIRKYIEDTAAQSGGMLPKDVAAMENVKRELAETRKLRDELGVLVSGLESERVSVGVNDAASARDTTVRQRYLAAIEAEARWLAQHGAPIPAGELQRLEAVDRRAGEFLKRAASLADERIAEIKRIVERERGNVAGYDSDLVTYQGETESLGGAIAARSFAHVMGRVDAVVLEADVGLVDVSWKQKEGRSKLISKVLERQSAEQEALKRNFDEVMSEQ